MILDSLEFVEVEVILPIKRTPGLAMPKADQAVRPLTRNHPPFVAAPQAYSLNFKVAELPEKTLRLLML